MTDKIKNNIVTTLMGLATGFALRRWPKLIFEALPMPAKAGEGAEGTGRATKPHGVLLVTARGGNAAALDYGIESAIASAIRFADFQAAGQEVPKGKIADKYREQARADLNVILKEQGLTRDGWLAHLDEFILNAGPSKPQTTVRVNADPKGINVEFRLLLTDTENMGRALKAFPNAVSTEKDETPYAGLTLKQVYDLFNAEQVKINAENTVETLAEKARRITEKLAQIQAEQKAAEEKLKAVSK